MSDTLDPKDLTAEERALWDAIVVREQAYIGLDDQSMYLKVAYWAEKCILARRKLYAAPEEEKAACPNCDEPGVDHYDQRGFYSCHRSEQPATPPAAAASVRGRWGPLPRRIADLEEYEAPQSPSIATEEPAPVADIVLEGAAESARRRKVEEAVTALVESELPEAVQGALDVLRRSYTEWVPPSDAVRKKAHDALEAWARSLPAASALPPSQPNCSRCGK